MTSFHQLLGKVFYAAAMADGVIKEEEVSRMNDLIVAQWEQDAQVIVDSFYLCVNLGYDKRQILSEIDAKKRVDPELFSKQTIERIVKTAYDIANATSGTNKSEIVYISQLRNALEK